MLDVDPPPWPQVTVFNVGKHSTLAQFEKILKSNGIEYKRAKKTPSITHGVLTFEVKYSYDGRRAVTV